MSHRGCVPFLLASVALVGGLRVAHAEVTVYDEQFVRGSGNPETVTDSFSVSDQPFQGDL
jgi:hypothetical protein